MTTHEKVKRLPSVARGIFTDQKPEELASCLGAFRCVDKPHPPAKFCLPKMNTTRHKRVGAFLGGSVALRIRPSPHSAIANRSRSPEAGTNSDSKP